MSTTSTRVRGAAVALLTVAVVLATPAVAQASPVDDYAGYEPQTRCAKKVKPGTKVFGRWLVRRGGSGTPSVRPCRSGGTSEHKDGRAFDWMLDARRKKDRRIAADFLEYVFATDAGGNQHAKARRMGLMYIIWNDHMYAAWDGFERESYLSSSCKRRKKCSPTLRHRNHVHISLSKAGARGETSWYAGRL